MGLITDRPWINCCQRKDVDGVPQPPYLHQCGCPTVDVVCVSEQKNASLCGISEFTGFESSPPKKYRSSVYSGECRADFATQRYKGEFSGALIYDTTCSIIQNDRMAIGVYSSTGSGVPICSNSAVFGARNNISCNTPLSSTSQRLRRAFFIGEWRCTNTLWENFTATECSDNGLETLSLEDTESDALTRATATAGTSCSSLYEVRTDDFDFTVRTSEYALVASNLIIGARYTSRVLIERRPAIKNPAGSGYVDANGDPSEWTTEDDESAQMIDEYTFTATASEQIVPTTGTWTDDDADEEIDNDEVTPAIALPNEVGWEYRIFAGYPKIELALTSV
jgi:hypothetical protein